MKSRLVGLLALVTLLGVSQAGAETLAGSTTDATGINGLVVDGVTYNVTFESASYDTVYVTDGLPNTFLGNPSGASDAASDLLAAINFLGVEQLIGQDEALYDGGNLIIPDSNDTSSSTNGGTTFGCIFSTGSYCSAGTWGGLNTYTDLADTAMGSETDYVVFSAVATTPLPPAFLLFATLLPALGWLGWRGKRKSCAAVAV